MTLLKYHSPFNYATLAERIFNQDKLNQPFSKFLPDVDLIESTSHFEIQVALPGIKKEDIKIDATEKLVTISGERKFVQEETSKTYSSVETKFGQFSRSFTLPENVNITSIEAQYIDGILTVIIPKDDKKKITNSITIK